MILNYILFCLNDCESILLKHGNHMLIIDILIIYKKIISENVIFFIIQTPDLFTCLKNSKAVIAEFVFSALLLK